MAGALPLRAAALAILLALPAGLAAAQLLQAADPEGCPARLVPSPGPLRLRVWHETAVLPAGLEARALEAYLAARLGRAVEVAEAQQGTEADFRLAAALRPWSREVLVFLADAPAFAAQEGAPGRSGALGFAREGTACAFVAAASLPPAPCALLGPGAAVHPRALTLAHELGHLLGLRHAHGGLMDPRASGVCEGDALDALQLARVRGWGR